jgi:hypothetical protein
MPYRLILGALVAFSLSACADAVVQPQIAEEVQARSMIEPIDGPIIDQPVDPDPCVDCNPDPCANGCYTPEPIPPFDPPAAPYRTADVPLIYGGFNWQYQSCNQIPHVGIAFSNDVTRGTTLYVGGVVVKGAYSNVYFYDVNGNLVKTHATARAHDNCVIYHEPEAISTWDLNPGYYYVYASYWSLTNGGYESTYGYPTGIVGRLIATIRVR